MNGQRAISLVTITAVSVKFGGTFSPGFIHFAYPGASQFRGGLIEATQDPDAFVFSKRENTEIEAFKSAVEMRIKELKSSKVPKNLSEVLERLASLHEAGHLTHDEFT
jgi:hypothetical protein